MDVRYEYSRTTYTYHGNYVRNTKAVGVLWGIFTICFAIINILVFMQPHWLGSSSGSPKPGLFGLYRYCTNIQQSDIGSTVWVCKGHFDTFDTILSPFFKAATILIGISALLILVCVACMLLFFFADSRVVFYLCSFIQLFCFGCMLSGCVVFAAGWDHDEVGRVCGWETDKFQPGACELRWAYVLAIIGIFDIFFLCILGFILACRRVKLLQEVPLRGESNLGFNGAYTRGPIITPLEGEHTSVAPSSRGKTDYASAHNLQL